jgi:hypothetical protein
LSPGEAPIVWERILTTAQDSGRCQEPQTKSLKA